MEINRCTPKCTNSFLTNCLQLRNVKYVCTKNKQARRLFWVPLQGIKREGGIDNAIESLLFAGCNFKFQSHSYYTAAWLRLDYGPSRAQLRPAPSGGESPSRTPAEHKLIAVCVCSMCGRIESQLGLGYDRDHT